MGINSPDNDNSRVTALIAEIDKFTDTASLQTFWTSHMKFVSTLTSKDYGPLMTAFNKKFDDLLGMRDANQNSPRTNGDHLRERIKYNFEVLKSRILSDNNPFRPLQENKSWTYALIRELTPEQKLELGNLVFDKAIANWPGRETTGFVDTILSFGLGLSEDRDRFTPPASTPQTRPNESRNAPSREEIIRDRTGRRVGTVLGRGSVLIINGKRTVIK